MEECRQIVLAARPEGLPRLSDFRLETAPMPKPGPGEMLVRMRVASMDAAIRGFLDDRPSYIPPVVLGAPVNGMSLGEIVASNHPSWPVGALVRVFATWSDHFVIGVDALGLEWVEPAADVAIEHYMGALGPVGLTAWVGLNVVGEAKPGETVLISAAAGATGSTAGQLAKAKGCRVIGLVGSPEKARLIEELGFDAAIDYRAVADLGAAIRSVAPDGVDVFFDNVGGEVLEAALPAMREHGRVAVCGMIGQYNDADHPYGVRTLWQLVVKRVRMQGFLTYDHASVLGQAQQELDRLVAEGRLKPLANIRHGFERIPEAFIDLMSGRTTGKTLVII